MFIQHTSVSTDGPEEPTNSTPNQRTMETLDQSHNHKDMLQNIPNCWNSRYLPRWGRSYLHPIEHYQSAFNNKLNFNQERYPKHNPPEHAARVRDFLRQRKQQVVAHKCTHNTCNVLYARTKTFSNDAVPTDSRASNPHRQCLQVAASHSCPSCP